MIPNSSNGFTPEELSWYHDLRDRLPGEKKIKSETEADVLCVNHGDRNPSLGFDLAKNGDGAMVLLNCRSQGCSFEDIVATLGLDSRDLFFRKNGKPKGCTLEQYARYKNLPVDFLKGEEVGLEDVSWWGVNAVRIPYADETGEVILNRYRISLSGESRVVSKKGDSVMLYGLHRIEEARKASYVLLVEGESDCHSAWYRGLPAVGIPGAKNWKDEWSSCFDGIGAILVLVEPDKGGEELWDTLSRGSLKDRLGKLNP